MLANYRNKYTNALIIGFSLMHLAGIYALYQLYKIASFNPEETFNAFTFFIALGLVFIGYFICVWAVYLLAKAKGQSGRYILLGLFNVYLGLVTVFMLPDKTKAIINSESPADSAF